MIVDVEFGENSQSFDVGFEESGNNFLPGFGAIHVVGGEKGKSAYEIAVDNGFEGTEEEWLASLQGKDGQDGVDGKDGKSAYQIAVDEGFDGSEAEWLASLNGKDGQDGVDGKDGKSAYQIAVDEGFEGSEAEWLASLQGKDGQDGVDGKDGTDGNTPQKGVDYFTPEDKAEMVKDVIAALPVYEGEVEDV